MQPFAPLKSIIYENALRRRKLDRNLGVNGRDSDIPADRNLSEKNEFLKEERYL